MQLIARAIGERSGRWSEDIEVRALAGAVVGVVTAVVFAVADDPPASLAALFDEAMSCLEEGFTPLIG
jgi:hypothetical protein